MDYSATAMVSRRLFGFLLAAAISLSPTGVLAQNAYTKSASSGKSQKIDSFFGWKNDCSFQTIDISVVRGPSNGSVTPKVENSRITQAQVGSTGKCLGKPTRALSVYYRSKKDFRGRDQFTVRMKVAGQRPVDFRYTINVR